MVSYVYPEGTDKKILEAKADEVKGFLMGVNHNPVVSFIREKK